MSASTSPSESKADVTNLWVHALVDALQGLAAAEQATGRATLGLGKFASLSCASRSLAAATAARHFARAGPVLRRLARVGPVAVNVVPGAPFFGTLA